MKFTIKYLFYSIIICLILLMIVNPVVASPLAQEDSQSDVESAIMSGFTYLQSQLNHDGGIRWFDENSNAATTLRIVQALAAAQLSQDYIISESGKSPIDFLAEEGESWINQEDTENPSFSVGRTGQLLTAIAAANKNPKSFGDSALDLITAINSTYNANAGVYGSAETNNVTDQVWAMIGLAASNASIPIEASNWLISAQAEDGSWDDGYGSYIDTTPLGILALISSGHIDTESDEIQVAMAFMHENQQMDGGWQSAWDTVTNASTTGIMLQVIYSLGQQPDDEMWEKPEGNPETALLSIQQDSGAFGGDFVNAYSTADAIVGLAGRPLTDLGILERASDSFDYLISKQEDGGGWGTVGQTLDIILAFESAGWDPNSIVNADQTPIDFISSNLDEYIGSGPDAIGKTILSLSAAGIDPSSFNDVNLIQSLLNVYNEETMSFGTADNTWHQAFAILGLYAANEEIPMGSIETLVDLQQDNGGWEYSPGFGTGSDNTALAIQALLAAGFQRDDTVIANALDYIRSEQKNDGGWGNSSTTAFVLMALNALDEPLDSWKLDSTKEPVSNLFTYQKANGAFLYSWEYPDDSIMSTSSALLAAFGEDYLVDSDTTDSTNLASIVVIPEEGSVYADCVEFEEDSISGLSLLERSDFSYNAGEGFISSLMDISNPEGETNYWSYWSWDGREWVFKSTGAGESNVLPGTIEAWFFTSWEIFPSLPPDFTPDGDQLCNTLVLKNYIDQPNLDYNDLFNVEVEAFEEPQQVAAPTDEEIFIIDPAGEEDAIDVEIEDIEVVEEESEESRSRIPLYIIISVGAVLLILLLFLFLRKRR